MDDARRAGDVVAGSGNSIDPGPRSSRPQARSRRRRLLSAAIAGAAAIAIVGALGLGSGRTASHPIRAGAPDPVRPAAVPMFDMTPELPYPQLSADVAARYAGAPWKLLSVTSGGTELHIGFAAGVSGCSYAKGVYVTESSTTVLVATLISRPTSGTCTSALMFGRTVIRLAKPLSSRTLRHAVIASEWEAVAAASPFAF